VGRRVVLRVCGDGGLGDEIVVSMAKLLGGMEADLCHRAMQSGG
jgi:hypothetical protein